MTLADFAGKVYLPGRIEVSADYAAFVLSVVRKFSTWLGRDADLTDLTEPTICRYLSDYRTHWSARSTNNQRQTLLMLWSAACDTDLLPSPPRPRRIRQLKVAADPPRAWTVEEIGRLLATVETLDGTIADVRASDWWMALLLTVYWSACRIGALMKTPTDCYRRGVGVLVRAQKNKTPQWYPLPEPCCERIDRTWPTSRSVLFPWDRHPKKIFGAFRQIIEAARLDCPHTGMMLFHRIRRTTISYCAAADPAIAQRTAGHASYQTTLRSYVDPTIAGVRSAVDVLPDPLKPQLRIHG